MAIGVMNNPATGTASVPAGFGGVLSRTMDQLISILFPEVDGYIWLPPFTGLIQAVSGTWTLTRDSAGVYHLLKTAGAATTILAIDLSLLFNKIGSDPASRGGAGAEFPGGGQGTGTAPGTAGLPGGGASHLIRGMQITGVDLSYTIGTANLTLLTLSFNETTFVNGSAVPTTSVKGGTLSPATLVVTQTANIRIGQTVLGTPFVVGANAPSVQDIMEIAVVDPGTSVFSLYGIGIYFNYTLL